MEIEVPVTEAIERERERSEVVEREREMGFWERRRARRLCAECMCERRGVFDNVIYRKPSSFFSVLFVEVC